MLTSLLSITLCVHTNDRTPLALDTRQAQLLEEEPVHEHFVLSVTAVRSRKQNHVTDFSLGIKKRDEDLVILLSP